VHGLTINNLRISGRLFCVSAVFHVFFLYTLHFIFFSEIVICLYYAYIVAYCCTLSTNKIITIIIIMSNQKRVDMIVRDQRCLHQRKGEFLDRI